MPYIQTSHRKYLAQGGLPTGVGELNYLVTMAVWEWVKRNGISYATINNAIGVLECAKLELYRRIASPYENKKLNENGDVYAEKETQG